MAGHFSKRLCAAFLSIAIVALAGGCNHPRSSPDGATAASNEVSHVSQELIGKQITIQGRFSLRGNVGPYIVLENQQQVYLAPMGSFSWGKPYSDMEGKLVAATGALRFYHEPPVKPTDPPVKPTDPPVQRLRDFFYFEAETVQVRLIGH
jgi:hypothetical protein